jgi:hypothetical protein
VSAIVTIESNLAGSETFNVAELGYKRLLRFDPVTADRVRLRMVNSRLCPTLARFGLYCTPAIEKVLGNGVPAFHI